MYKHTISRQCLGNTDSFHLYPTGVGNGILVHAL